MRLAIVFIACFALAGCGLPEQKPEKVRYFEPNIDAGAKNSPLNRSPMRPLRPDERPPHPHDRQLYC